ncbi:MAG: hypothetical protein ABR600_14580 [Actinomycetota bacterium]
MKWLLRGGLLLFALAIVPGTAHAQSSQLRGTGTVSGALQQGSLLSVHLHVQHAEGWQHIQEIDVTLDLRGSTLERLQFAPTQSSLAILGDGSPASLGQTTTLQGSYFQINPSKVSLSARGGRLAVTIPIRLRTDPPPGARLEFSASAVPLASLGPKALTPPVESSSGFSWGTLGAAALAALLLGGFVGNVLGVRRRPTPRVSVYGAVQRRLSQEKAKR